EAALLLHLAELATTRAVEGVAVVQEEDALGVVLAVGVLAVADAPLHRGHLDRLASETLVVLERTSPRPSPLGLGETGRKPHAGGAGGGVPRCDSGLLRALVAAGLRSHGGRSPEAGHPIRETGYPLCKTLRQTPQDSSAPLTPGPPIAPPLPNCGQNPPERGRGGPAGFRKSRTTADAYGPACLYF